MYTDYAYFMDNFHKEFSFLIIPLFPLKSTVGLSECNFSFSPVCLKLEGFVPQGCLALSGDIFLVVTTGDWMLLSFNA